MRYVPHEMHANEMYASEMHAYVVCL
jgi:hypothetical protein